MPRITAPLLAYPCLTAHDRVSCCLFMYSVRHRTARRVAYSCLPCVSSPQFMPVSYRASCCLFMYAAYDRTSCCLFMYAACHPKSPAHRACPRLTACDRALLRVPAHTWRVVVGPLLCTFAYVTLWRRMWNSLNSTTEQATQQQESNYLCNIYVPVTYYSNNLCNIALLKY